MFAIASNPVTPRTHFGTSDFESDMSSPYWLTISPGSGWPDARLDKAIDDFFYAGRVVYVDFDPEIWQTGVRENSREAAGLEMIRRSQRPSADSSVSFFVSSVLPTTCNDRSEATPWK